MSSTIDSVHGAALLTAGTPEHRAGSYAVDNKSLNCLACTNILLSGATHGQVTSGNVLVQDGTPTCVSEPQVPDAVSCSRTRKP